MVVWVVGLSGEDSCGWLSPVRLRCRGGVVVQCGICQMVAVGVSLRGLLLAWLPRIHGVHGVDGVQSLSPSWGCEAGEWGFCAWCVAPVDCHVSPVWWAAFVVLRPLVVCLAFGGGVCWPGLVGVSCFGWLSVAALGAARGTVSGCFRTPVVVWPVPLVWGPLQVLLGLVRGHLSSFPAGGPVAVPVGVVLSGLAVVFVPVVLCCPWLGAGVGSAAQHIL